MKRMTCLLLSALLALGLVGCGSSASSTPEAAEPVQTQAPAETAEPTEPAALGADGSGVLVVYFSRVGNTAFPEDMDAVSSATLSRVDGVLKGNAQRMAEWMAEETGGDLFEILTEESYPVDYRETTDAAKREQNENARPALASRMEGLDGYATVYLVFPNWWGDLPMALYSFFDEYDFSGKRILVSITHEGSGFSRTVKTIQDLEPEAAVEEGLSIRGGAVPDSEEAVRQFARGN